MDKHALFDLQCKGYDEIRNVLGKLAADELIDAIDSKSNKIGDAAAHALINQNLHETVAEALLSGKIKSASGRVRASFVLNMRGSACDDDIKVYEYLLRDRSDHVVSNALFGLVFFPSRDSLPVLRAIALSIPESRKRRQMFNKAIKALEQGDPSIFSPHYRDRAGVWQHFAPPDNPVS